MATQLQVIDGLVKAMQTRDPSLAAHSAAVAQLGVEIADAVGIVEGEIELVRTAGMMHDIGRLALPDWPQTASSRLREADWFAICSHPDVGADLLDALGSHRVIVEAVRVHHERLDGRGYPRALRAGEIPAIARVIAVAEAFDALTSTDGYRTPVSSFAALHELRRVASTQFDADCIEGLASVLRSRSGRHDRDSATAVVAADLREIDGRAFGAMHRIAKLR